MREQLEDSVFRTTAGDATRLGSVLERHRQTTQRTWPEVAARLNIDVAALAKLALCAVPREEQFAEDVTAAAQACGIEPRALAELLREIELHGDWVGRTTTTGWTLAAHDADQAPLGEKYDAPRD